MTMHEAVAPLRIGLLMDTMTGGGAVRVTLNLINAFSELGHEPHLFLIAHKVEHSLAGLPHGCLHTLSKDGAFIGNKKLDRPLLARKLRSQIKSVEDVDGRSFAFFISHTKGMNKLVKIARIKNVFICRHSIWSIYRHRLLDRKVGLRRVWRRWFFPRKFRSSYCGQHIVAVSSGIEREIDQMGARPASIRTIYSPFVFRQIREQATEASDYPREPYILYPAHFQERKRHDLMLRAYARAALTEKLVLMGRTYDCVQEAVLANVRELATELGISDQVIFPGFRANPYPWIKHAHLLAMSSDSEGLPTILVEALILGTPVISTDCPVGPSEVLTGELACFLSPVGDADALARNMRIALQEYPVIEDRLISKFDHLESARHYLRYAAEMFSGVSLEGK